MTWMLVLLSGALLATGLVLVVLYCVPAVPDLRHSLDRIAGNRPLGQLPLADLGQTDTRSERLGAWLYRHSPISLTEGQRQSLRLREKSIAEFYADKAVFAIIGALLPGFAVTVWTFIISLSAGVPVIAGLAGAIIGYFIPDLLLLRGAKAARSDAVESLLTFIDLVTLERLANASATQALRNAATLSDTALFTHIRAALDRAQLEQTAPYAELRRLATQLNLPELVDVADVMQLDESGAALSGALRARVRELRDAHLTKMQIEANAASEGMTIYMTIPALIFGLIFMVPPLMRIMAT